MTDFGDWWSARNAVAVDVIGDADKRQIQLSTMTIDIAR